MKLLILVLLALAIVAALSQWSAPGWKQIKYTMKDGQPVHECAEYWYASVNILSTDFNVYAAGPETPAVCK